MSINSRHHSDEPRTVKAVILVGLLVGGLERNEPPPCQEGVQRRPGWSHHVKSPAGETKDNFSFLACRFGMSRPL